MNPASSRAREIPLTFEINEGREPTLQRVAALQVIYLPDWKKEAADQIWPSKKRHDRRRTTTLGGRDKASASESRLASTSIRALVFAIAALSKVLLELPGVSVQEKTWHIGHSALYFIARMVYLHINLHGDGGLASKGT